jgi:PadR family transcriptional regulator PadR
MPGHPRRTERAIAETTSVEEARRAAGARVPRSVAPAGVEPAGAGSADPLLAELRRAGLLPLLVLHFLAVEASYGNQLMERIGRLSGGLLAVNPNTMYPLLRSLEARGLIAGAWEHPQRRSRRFYGLTPAGAAERDRLAGEFSPHLAQIAACVELIRDELAGASTSDAR